MPISAEKKIYRNFILSTGLVTGLVLTGIFVNMAIRTRQLLNEETLIQARVVFNTILLARQWNAGYGGVYVEKGPGVHSNPYLVNPDLQAIDGRVLTRRNPALMTREISEFSGKEGMFRFHLTSLRPMNPENRPDAFEEQALQKFEREGLKEISIVERVDGRAIFRYMAPLYVEDDCLQCHKYQNYRTGQVRGGISILFDIEDLQQKISRHTVLIILFGMSTTAALLGLIYFFTAQLMRKLAEARCQIEKIAITDELTGLYNRRHILNRFNEEFEKGKRLNTGVCCIMADIDHFKAVNDEHGHLKGDEVLKGLGHLFKKVVRAYDIAGRYGGEEFLIILPDTRLEQAWNFAERIRMQVRESIAGDVKITISMGVTCVQETDGSVDDTIRRADRALYKAKNGGRDRVEWLPVIEGPAGTPPREHRISH